MVVHLKTPDNALSPREELFLNTIKRVELKTPFDHTSSSSGSYAKRYNTKSLKPLSNWGSKIGDLFDNSFPIDTWWPVLKFHQNNLQVLVEKFKPDVLWSTADPWCSHSTAMALAKKSKIPWVADFRDPWTLCPIRSGPRMPWARAIDKNVERKVLTYADQAVFTAENTANNYRKHYSDVSTPMTTIYNSFDDEFFLPPELEEEQTSAGKFKILFYGRFRSLSPAESAIRLLEAVKLANPEVLEHISIQSCGELPDEDAKKAHGTGVLSAFESVNPEPYENTLIRLNQADMLLLSTEQNRNEIIPAKLWDYLSAGKPIVSFSQNPEVAEILKQTKTGAQFAIKDMDKASDFLIDCFIAKKEGRPLPYSKERDRVKIQAYSSVNTTAQLATLFDQLKG